MAKLLFKKLQNDFSGGLTLRSTRTLPLRVRVLFDLSRFLVPNHRAASAAPVSFVRWALRLQAVEQIGQGNVVVHRPVTEPPRGPATETAIPIKVETRSPGRGRLPPVKPISGFRQRAQPVAQLGPLGLFVFLGHRCSFLAQGPVSFIR